MASKKQSIGASIRSMTLSRMSRRETLGDLDYRGSSRQYHESLVTAFRDGAQEQRCGGGCRIIRKRTPE